MQKYKPRIKFTPEEIEKSRPTEEQKKRAQVRKARSEVYFKYVEKLNNAEKAAGPSKKRQPYYRRKKWLIERAGIVLDVWMTKPAPGFEDFHKNYHLVIYPHEAAKILDKSLRSAQRVLKEIRELHNKPPRVPVTFAEFCAYHHLDEEKTKLALFS